MTNQRFILLGSIVLVIAIYWVGVERSRTLSVRGELAAVAEKSDQMRRQRDRLIEEAAASKRQVAELAGKQPPQGSPSIPTAEDNSDGTIERVGQLKRMLLLHPEYGLPEFDLLSDEDWLNAAKTMKRDTEAEERFALGLMRQAAKQKFIPELRAAQHAYSLEHGGERADDPQLLKRYLANPKHEEIFDRYERWSGEPSGGRDWHFQERAVADNWYDSKVFLGADGAVGLIAVGLGQDVNTAARIFREEHGNNPRSASDLRPYLKTPIDDRVLNELFDTLGRR